MPVLVCPCCRTEYDPPRERCDFDGSDLVVALGGGAVEGSGPADEYDVRSPTPLFGTPIVGEPLGELGPYRLLSVLGEGSMAVVYAAEHVRLGRRAAIKKLRREHLGDAEPVQRFLAEARAIASIDHPNLVRIQDVVEEPGAVYLVMELLDGRSLETVLHTGPLPVARALRIAAELCDALGAVHERGIVHRDVKPANVFLSIVGDREHVKLLDFGAARLLDPRVLAAEARLEKAGTTLGSPLYMSPEQVSGEALDGRSDIYSVGVVLYEALAGQPPFVGETFSDVMLQHASREPTSLVERGVAVSAEIDALVMRCLAKSPEARPQTVQELARALRRVGAPPSTVLGEGMNESRTPRAGTWLGLWAATVGAALVVGALAFAQRRTPWAGAAVERPGPAEVEVKIAPASATPPEPPRRRSVRFESDPPGALVVDGDRGQTCSTPCALAMPELPTVVTFRRPGLADERVEVGPADVLVRRAPPTAPARLPVVEGDRREPRRDRLSARLDLQDGASRPAVEPAAAPTPAPAPTSAPEGHISGSQTLNPFGE